MKKMTWRNFPVETLLFAVCGVLYPLPYLRLISWFDFSLPWAVAAALLPVLLIILARQMLPKAAWIVSLLLLFGLGYAAWRLRLRLLDLLWAINDRYFETIPENPDATLLVGLCLAVWSTLLMILETFLAGHLLLSFIVLGAAVAMPIIGIHAEIAAGLPGFLFIVGFFWLHGQILQASGRKAAREPHPQKRVHGMSALLVVVAILAFTGASYVVTRNTERLYQTAFDVEGWIYRFLDRFQRNTGDYEEGAISRSNCFPLDKEYLRLFADRRPYVDLYLKGFSGGTYEDGVWKENRDLEIYEQIAEQLGWERNGERLEKMFKGMYFMRCMQAVPADQELTLAVKRMNGKDLPYQPYYNRPTTRFLDKDGNERDFGQNTSLMKYYELLGHVVDPEQNSGLEQVSLSYHMLENMYIQAIRELYTELPAEGLERMRALAAENPKESLDEITAFIQSTLQSMAEYSLTPGSVPVGTDVTEYFLFESGKGYCEHFASAATILYRLYGVPARYVTGYMVTPGAFEPFSGYWMAKATDRQAHAWTEIFIADYGWVPVDVTPVSNGAIPGQYPGFHSATYESMIDAAQPEAESRAFEDLPFPDYFADLMQETNRTDTYVPAETPVPKGSGRWKEILWRCGTAVLGLLLGIALLEGRRRILLRTRRKKRCVPLFGLLIDILHAGGLPKNVTGEEEEPAAAFARFFPEIEIRKAYGIAEKEAFSNQPPSAEDKAFLLETIHLAAEKLRQDPNRLRRLWFRWGRAFI